MNEQAFATETVSTRVIHCPKCGAALTGENKFCPQCGENLTPPTPVCQGCGATLPDNVSFCPLCGTRYSTDPIPAPVPAPAPVPTPATPAPEKAPAINKKNIIIIASCAAVALIAILTIIIAVVLANRPVPVERLSLSDTAITLTEGENKTVSATVFPTDADDKTVTWTSSDSKVATVNSYGKIEAVKKGTCTITATCGSISKTIEITVKKKLPDLRKLYNDYCTSSWAEIGSDNSYLEIDDNPYDYDDYFISAADSAIQEINRQLNLPSSLYNDMLQTSWDMGKQRETYESIGIEVSWTYHPDKGLEVIYKLLID